MTIRRRKTWWKTVGLLCGGGMLLQVSGCIDPDVLLQAGIQFLTEFAIYATNQALVNLR